MEAEKEKRYSLRWKPGKQFQEAELVEDENGSLSYYSDSNLPAFKSFRDLINMKYTEKNIKTDGNKK